MATVATLNIVFATLDVGCNIFGNSPLVKLLSSGSMNLPEPKAFPVQDTPTPYIFFGNEAFHLMSYLILPNSKGTISKNYQRKFLTIDYLDYDKLLKVRLAN